MTEAKDALDTLSTNATNAAALEALNASLLQLYNQGQHAEIAQMTVGLGQDQEQYPISQVLKRCAHEAAHSTESQNLQTTYDDIAKILTAAENNVTNCYTTQR